MTKSKIKKKPLLDRLLMLESEPIELSDGAENFIKWSFAIVWAVLCILSLFK